MNRNENLGRRIGNNIKFLRKEKKITQEKLSEISGVAVNTIRNIEQGGWPSEKSLTSIANALDVEAKILLGSVNDEIYVREEIKTQLETGMTSILKNIINNSTYISDHLDKGK